MGDDPDEIRRKRLQRLGGGGGASRPAPQSSLPNSSEKTGDSAPAAVKKPLVPLPEITAQPVSMKRSPPSTPRANQVISYLTFSEINAFLTPFLVFVCVESGCCCISWHHGSRPESIDSSDCASCSITVCSIKWREVGTIYLWVCAGGYVGSMCVGFPRHNLISQSPT